ncbi:MAG: hypothetical protein IPN74_07220 [Haliscomenobacter sp.]|nr:hypothetical protein [Haliscomenobacter sp.]MBK8878335.1 hypothetical protein [Haliscomenobacter sp.]
MWTLARFGHVALAALLLLSSAGITLNKHFCQGELRSQALFVQPPSCHAQAAAGRPACPFHDSAPSPKEDAENGCCDDQSIFLKQDGPQQVHTFDWKLSLPALMPVFFAAPSMILPFWAFSARISALNWAFDLPPPKVALRILFQVFRI